MVETSSSVLKKPFFKSKEKFFLELLSKYSNAEVKDDEGNNLAHLGIYYGFTDKILELHHLLDLKNKKGITPRDLLRWLGKEASIASSLSLFRTSEEIFDTPTQEELENHFKFHPTSHLKFESSKDLVWTLNQTAKILQKESIKRKNLWIDSLYGNYFLSQRFAKTYVKWVSSLIGYGLFAKEDIPQYSLIGEYTGIVRKRAKRKDEKNDYIFGYVIANKETPYVIDASKEGNHTRFINHSDDPNLHSSWLIHKGLCHIILVTNSYIPKNTQITLDYGPYYWRKRGVPIDL